MTPSGEIKKKGRPNWTGTVVCRTQVVSQATPKRISRCHEWKLVTGVAGPRLQKALSGRTRSDGGLQSATTGDPYARENPDFGRAATCVTGFKS